MSVAHAPPNDLDELLMRLDHWREHFDTPMATDCGYAAEALRRTDSARLEWLIKNGGHQVAAICYQDADACKYDGDELRELIDIAMKGSR